MSSQYELDPTDYHLRLLIENMQRDGRSENAIEQAVRIASGCNRPATNAGTRDTGRCDRRRVFNH